MLALTGQISFTLMHLAGTVVFSTLLSPVLYLWVVRNEALEFKVSSINPQVSNKF